MLDMGAQMNGASSSSGVTENAINLKLAFKLQHLLEQSGTTVILTRSDENGIYNLDADTIREQKTSDIKNRVEIVNNSNADMFVSIHLNKIPQSQYYGWQTFFRANDDKSEKLAKCIQANLNESIERENKREALVIRNKYIVDKTKMPVTIVECGFLSNPEEAQLLAQEEYQDRLAWGIYLGINQYFY